MQRFSVSRLLAIRSLDQPMPSRLRTQAPDQRETDLPHAVLAIYRSQGLRRARPERRTLLALLELFSLSRTDHQRHAPASASPSIVCAYCYCTDGLRATRKPRRLTRFDGASPRFADRQRPGVNPQQPPRNTRVEPPSGPIGSTPPISFPSYQSEHHSHTLPCMSCKPQGLGFFKPTL